jgi:hypothetical protein
MVLLSTEDAHLTYLQAVQVVRVHSADL